MKKIAQLPFLIFTLLLTLSSQAQTTSAEGQGGQDKNRTNSVSGQFQMVNPGRKLLVTPDWSTTKVDQSCKISWILEVDATGKVLHGKIVEAKTTTSDYMLLEQALDRMRSEARYEAKSGSSIERVPYEISLSAE